MAEALDHGGIVANISMVRPPHQKAHGLTSSAPRNMQEASKLWSRAGPRISYFPRPVSSIHVCIPLHIPTSHQISPNGGSVANSLWQHANKRGWGWKSWPQEGVGIGKSLNLKVKGCITHLMESDTPNPPRARKGQKCWFCWHLFPKPFSAGDRNHDTVFLLISHLIMVRLTRNQVQMIEN
jgi:hypothetical protein